jgi:predicted ATPase
VEIPPIPFPTLLGSGHRETLLHAKADQENILTARVIRNIMRRCQVFQFHDTSDDARIRKACGLDANQFLYKDAGNLAAFLYTLKEADNRSYQKIVSTIRLVTRQFSDFVLEPDLFNLGMIFLKWREPGNDHIFGPHQLPDGLLRFMALATLFLQPEKTLPNVIIVDEPELGLHPLAVELLASLIREVSHNRQVIVATQSPTLVDQFEPEDIIVVERSMSDGLNEYPTTFRRLKRPALESWIEEYTMGELWRKNVFGGRP